jgi:tRNA dimethylallyltransferase
LLFEK